MHQKYNQDTEKYTCETENNATFMNNIKWTHTPSTRYDNPTTFINQTFEHNLIQFALNGS